MQRIVVSSPKGGVGKTTLTTGLAVLASLNGLRVTVVDLDPQGSLTRWYDARIQQARRQAGNDEASIEAIVGMQHASGLLDDARDVVEQITVGDVVLIDTPTAVEEHPEGIKTLLRAADLVIVPTRPGDWDTASVIPWMRRVRSLAPRSGYVLNMTKPRDKWLSEARRRLAATGLICAAEVRDLADVTRAAALGVGVAEIPKSAAADDMRGVWAWVRDELGVASWR